MYRYLIIIVCFGFISSCDPDGTTPRITGAWVGDLIINENMSLRIGYEGEERLRSLGLLFNECLDPVGDIPVDGQPGRTVINLQGLGFFSTFGLHHMFVFDQWMNPLAEKVVVGPVTFV